MTVLLAYSPSPQSQAAFDSALRQAQLRGSDLVVVNVRRGGSLVDPGYADDEQLAPLLQRATDAAVSVSVERPESSHVAAAVLDLAERLGAELVVLGIRHRTPVGKLIMGSVSQMIILDAACEVLAVKGAKD